MSEEEDRQTILPFVVLAATIALGVTLCAVISK